MLVLDEQTSRQLRFLLGVLSAYILPQRDLAFRGRYRLPCHLVTTQRRPLVADDQITLHSSFPSPYHVHAT